MFHYNFKTKRAFKRRVLQGIYEEFFQKFQFSVGGEGRPEERLKRAVLFLGTFARDNRAMLLGFLRDAVNGDPDAVAFVQNNFLRHVSVVMALIAECQAKGVLEKRPLPFVFPMFMGAVALPNLVVAMMERAGAQKPFGVPLARAVEQMIGGNAVADRIDILMKGLSAR
jgi:AcrR family transcriptional regulator